MRRGRLAGAAVVLAFGLAGCGSPVTPGSAGLPEPAASTPSSVPSSTAPPEPVPSARVGAAAPSTRVRFVPTSVVLSGGATAVVEPAATVGGELKVPENVQHVGWWDGSAEAGDPFGTTVIAGHVDSATEGLGFFSRLLAVKKGQVVTVTHGHHRARYRVTSVKTVKKQALATSSSAFDQLGDHRLVLITCGGAYRADRGGYDSNVVVTAAPLGPAR
ncbi:class F sortase [uncultured Friedmanniella sp.]|uniref:class F sortase n=1 Tax=uncultured Friedmanniella sp. TaxID=335381 RepID=UPI0035CC8807